MKPLRTAAILLIFAIATVVFGAVLVILDLPLQFLVIMLVPVIAFSVDYPRSIYLPMILFFTGVAVWASFNLSPNLQNSLQTILATLIFAVATCEIVSWLAGRGRQVEEALRESEEKYRLIFEGSRDGIIFLDSENRREFANRRLAEIDGYTEEELAGKSVMSVVHPEDLPQIRENNRRRLAGESFSHTYEFRLIHKDGHPVDVEGTFNAIKRDDKVIGICGIIRDISDRKRAEAELELIHAYAPCILWRGDVEWRDGKAHWSIRVANPEAAQRFLPIAKDPAEDYFEALARNRAEFAKETMQLDEDAARAFAEGSSHLQHAFPCRRSDGEIRWIYEDAYIQPAGPDRWQVAGVSTDITDRRRSEDEIKQALSLLAATLESTVDGILVVDLKGKVLSFNKKFLDLWRIPATVVETNDDRIMLQFVMEQLSDPKGFMAKVQELYAHPDRESSDTINFKDGRLFERFSQPQWIEGKSVGRVWSFRDVTERKQAEEDRLMMERQMQQTQQLESLGVLAGGIAHDFNNILMAILGHADLALDDVTPTSPVHDALLEIIKASRRAAELCRQMLAYSGRGSFVIETIALSGLIDDMVHLLRTSISKSAVLKLDLDREARPIRGDATQIRQIILNLIVNASEAIGEREGVITVTAGMIECTQPDLADMLLGENLPEGPYVRLEVSDTGDGMDEETIEHIFEPFFTTKFTGRGLGLSAALGIVRGHRGALKVCSELGKGTSFRILFPPAEGDARPPAKEDLLVNDSWQGTGKVLLVDDEKTIRALGKRMLERLGFEVLTASDGLEALQVYRDMGQEIDLVLLDLTMPRMNGEEAYRELQRLDPNVRVILSSGYTEQDVATRFEGKRAVRFIQKPYTLGALRDCLRLAMSTDTEKE